MHKYRDILPQVGRDLFVTDGGIETTLIYHNGIELPCFAAFDLLKDAMGTAVLRRYYANYANLAREHGLGLVLESATWRASADWGSRLGYDAKGLAAINRKSIDLLLDLRREFQTPSTHVVVSGALGPRGDGYVAASRMKPRQAYTYHAEQVETFAATAADMVSAFTINYVDEAIGIVWAAQESGIPVAIAFTVETDGRLPSGQRLREAIEQTDEATGAYPAYYMINCAHPTHFAHVLQDGGRWLSRIRGIRANASMKSHAELDASTELDAGDPVSLALQYDALREVLPKLTVVGGCCGTDHRHVGEIAGCWGQPNMRRAGVSAPRRATRALRGSATRASRTW